MPANLIRITYASTATFKTDIEGGIESEVARILLQSRRNNSKIAVGGVLHYGEGYFFQCLEGEESKVTETLQRIAQDSRHRDIKVLTKSPIQRRLFTDWSMKYLALEKNLMAVMEQHGLDNFNPYEFSAPLIDELLKVCALGIEPKAFASKQSPSLEAERPWWKRWLGVSQAS
ncbi:MAG: BLUF domain-containing protein [Gammaproteobacteria bacterium]|nr:BLUF domain-containing protein [Gammaproteobacteria bacterium]NVK89660.1 BLUF domain-containing protein [Gammaproteobacteria bacterium]